MSKGVRPVALTIAGSDPSGGAGIQADLKTFHQFGVYGEAVITLLTVQNTVGVKRVEVMDGDLVGEQMDAVFEDIPPAAVKTGALGSREVIEAVAARAASWKCPLVVDPVMISKHGATLLEEEAQRALLNQLLPFCLLVTPNIPEAEALSGLQIRSENDMAAAGKAITKRGARAVLVKGGHREGDAIDILWTSQGVHRFHAPRVNTRHTHGTGCTYSAAITALLASGVELEEAVRRAKRYIHEAIATNPGLGSGSGPVNHFAAVSSEVQSVVK